MRTGQSNKALECFVWWLEILDGVRAAGEPLTNTLRVIEEFPTLHGGHEWEQQQSVNPCFSSLNDWTIPPPFLWSTSIRFKFLPPTLVSIWQFQNKCKKTFSPFLAVTKISRLSGAEDVSLSFPLGSDNYWYLSQLESVRRLCGKKTSDTQVYQKLTWNGFTLRGHLVEFALVFYHDHVVQVALHSPHHLSLKKKRKQVHHFIHRSTFTPITTVLKLVFKLPNPQIWRLSSLTLQPGPSPLFLPIQFSSGWCRSTERKVTGFARGQALDIARCLAFVSKN